MTLESLDVGLGLPKAGSARVNLDSEFRSLLFGHGHETMV